MQEIMKILKALSRYVKSNRLSSKFIIENGKLIFSDESFLLIYELGDRIEDGKYVIVSKNPLQFQRDDEIEYPDWKVVVEEIERQEEKVMKGEFYVKDFYILEWIIYSLARVGVYINSKYFPLLRWFLEKCDKVLVKIDKTVDNSPVLLDGSVDWGVRKLVIAPLLIEAVELKFENSEED